VELFNIRKLNKLDVRKRYQTEITSRFPALENLSVGEDKNRAWENNKENIKTSAMKSLVCTSWSSIKHNYEKCLGFLDQ
jgi:hypothetical protein